MASSQLTDVVVATVLPFTPSGEIDWPGYRNVLEYCATPDGISAVFVNGHAGEGATLTAGERRRVIEVTREFLGAAKPVLAGVIAYGTADAVREAKEAVAAGADIPVVFPPPILAGGGAATPDAPLAHVRAIADAVGGPISVFQYPVGSGLGYTVDTLVAMARLPNVVAIKEGSDTMTLYEDVWRRVKAANPAIAVLPSNFDWFLPQLAVGGDGILSGLASLTPHLLIDLWRAAEARNLEAMRTVNDHLYPIVRTIYGRAPRMDMHTRIKVGLRRLGLIGCAMPRGPLLPVSPAIEAEIAAVVDAAGLARHVRSGIA